MPRQVIKMPFLAKTSPQTQQGLPQLRTDAGNMENYLLRSMKKKGKYVVTAINTLETLSGSTLVTKCERLRFVYINSGFLILASTNFPFLKQTNKNNLLFTIYLKCKLIRRATLNWS